MKTKRCNKCKIVKSIKEFAKRTRSKDGLNYYCRKCESKRRANWKRNSPEKYTVSHRKSLLKKRYGVTLKQYDKMFDEQGGGCAICGGINKSGYRLAVDHDHNTGRIRALLCQNCNRKIGEMESDPGLFDKLVIYLHDHSSLTSE